MLSLCCLVVLCCATTASAFVSPGVAGRRLATSVFFEKPERSEKLPDGVIDVGDPLGPADLAQEFYDCWNRGDTQRAIACFSNDVVFHDMNNRKPYVGKAATLEYFEDCIDSLPGWQFVVDDFAEDKERGRLGVMWHVEDKEGDALPIPTRGLSFLKFDEDGLICECMDIPEPTVKAGSLQLPVLKVVSRFLPLLKRMPRESV